MAFGSVLLALAAASPEAAASDTAQKGVIPYPASFFAEARPSTALDMISRLPGFSLDQGDDVRGFAGAAGNLLINGERPTTKSDSVEDMLRRIAAANVERIDLIRGGAPGIDMQGRSVLANVVIKKTVQVERVINLDTYAYPDGFLGPILELQGSRREGVDLLEGSLKATRDRTDQTYDGATRVRRDAAGVVTSREALKGYDIIENYVARGAIQRAAFGGKARVNGKIASFTFDRDVTAGRIFPNARQDSTGEAYNSLNGEFGVRYDRKLDPRTDLQLVFLQTLNREEFGSISRTPGLTADYLDHSVSGETILRTEVKRKRSETLSFELSGEAAYNVRDGKAAYRENGAVIDIGAAQVKVEELRGEAAAKAVWRAGAKLNVEAGARLEASRISQSGDTDLTRTFFYPKPRVLLTWSPTKADQVRLRLEREVDQLDFGDFVASAGLVDGTINGADADLAPSRTWVAELTWEKRFWDAGVASATLTHAQISDVIDFKPVAGGFDAPSNIGDGTADQFVANLTLPTARMGVSGGQFKARLSWARSRVTDPVTFDERPISGRSPFVCDLRFTRDMPGGRWSWGLITFCPETSRDYRLNEVRTRRFGHWLEGFVEWKPRPGLTVRAEMANLALRHVERVRVFYAGGRGAGVVSQVETRDTPFEPYMFIKIRKSL